MPSKLIPVTARIVSASLMMLVVMAAPAVMAQAEQEAITPAEETGRWVGLLLTVFLLIALCIGCYMTPKRTHQD